MFESFVNWPWWIFCILVVICSSVFSIAMRFVDKDMEDSLFCASYTALLTFFMSLFCAFLIVSGESLIYTPLTILVGLGLGFIFIAIDLGTLAMYRAGAPVSLGMPLVRTLLFVASAIIGFIVFSESMDIIKIVGIILCSSGVFLMGQVKEEN